MDFTLPPLVIRGQQVKIPFSTYNYMDSCAEVLTPLPPKIHAFPVCWRPWHLYYRRQGRSERCLSPFGITVTKFYRLGNFIE
jgi:hypothetical protein